MKFHQITRYVRKNQLVKIKNMKNTHRNLEKVEMTDILCPTFSNEKRKYLI